MQKSNVHTINKLLQSLKAGAPIASINVEDKAIVEALLRSIRSKKQQQTAISVPSPEVPREDHSFLKKAIAEKEEYMKAMEEQFRRVIERVESGEEVTKMTVNYLNNQVSVLKKEREELSIRYEELRNGMAHHSESGEQDTLKEHLQDLQAQLKEWHKSNDMLKDRNLQLELELQQNTGSKNEETQALKHQIEQLNTAVTSKKEKVALLEQQIQAMERNVQHTNADHLEEVIALKKQLETEQLKSQQLVGEKEALSADTESTLNALREAEKEARKIAQEMTSKTVNDVTLLKQIQQENVQLKQQLTAQKEVETMSQETPMVSNQIQEELLALKEQIEELTEENARLAKRNEDIIAEANLPEQVKETGTTVDSRLEASLLLTQKFNQSYFKNFEQIEEQFNSFNYFSHPIKEYNGHLLHLTEKFGVTYLVMIRTPFNGLEGQIFSMVASFTLSNIIRTKKYINSSRLVEEFYYAVRPALMLIDKEKVERQLQVGVCLLDTANLEVEYASNGSSLYYVKNGELGSLYATKQDVDDKQAKRFGFNNTYQVKKLNLMKNDQLIFLSEEADSALLKIITKVINTPPDEQDTALENWVSRNRTDTDFLFAQIEL